MEDMNIAEMATEQAVETTAAADVTKGDMVKAGLATGATMLVGYGLGKLIELGLKKLKTAITNRKKANAIEAQPEETVEVEVVD
jgi:hypothetical protein